MIVPLIHWLLLLLPLFPQLAAAQGPRSSTAPDEADVWYGSHERHVLDLWRATGGAASPVVVYFHAGGFTGGDKRDVPESLIAACRRHGFSLVSANYRFSTHARYPGPMLDGARVIQFVRGEAGKELLQRLCPHVRRHGGLL